MRPFYDARVSDIGPGDLVIIECVCGHQQHLTAGMLKTGLASYAPIKELDRRMRCRECDERGRVSISIKWADA